MITRNEIFTRVHNAVKEAFPAAYVTGERNRSPSEFPCAWVVEIDRTPTAGGNTINLEDEQVRSTFDVNVFSNLKTGGYAQCDAMMGIIAESFRKMGFRNTQMFTLDNQADTSIKRMAARFTRIIGGGDMLPTIEKENDTNG